MLRPTTDSNDIFQPNRNRALTIIIFSPTHDPTIMCGCYRVVPTTAYRNCLLQRLRHIALSKAALTRDGKVLCWGSNEHKHCCIVEVPGALENVIAISCGGYHTVALTDEGTVVCWGLNDDGQCSPPSPLEHVVCISAGGRYTAAVTIYGRVICWGRNVEGQCNVPAGVDNVSDISCGDDFTVALTKHKTVICWGSNEAGECNVPLDLLDVVAVSAGVGHTAASVHGGQVRCWGWNFSGQCKVPENLQVVMKGDALADEYSATPSERFRRLSTLRTFGLNRTKRLNREIVDHANTLRSKNKALYAR
jgi:alpha-tubulin suppressor-like RCC1 family protein